MTGSVHDAPLIQKEPSFGNLVEKSIDRSIHHCEKWMGTAQLVQKIAGGMFIAGLVCTALVFISPALPIIGAIVIVSVAVIGQLSTDMPSYSYTPLNGLALLVSAVASFSGTLGDIVYTPTAVTIALIANSVFALPLLCTVGSAFLFEKYLERKKQFFQELRADVQKMDEDPSFLPSETTRQTLLQLYQDLYIRKLHKGDLPILPARIESRMAKLRIDLQ